MFDKNTAASTDMLTEEQFMGRYVPVNEYDYPIMKDSYLRKGVYLNFLQFVSNSPQQETDDLPEYESTPGHDDMMAEVSRFAKAGSNAVWGYCDGKTVYVNTWCWTGFYPLVRRGNHFDLTAKAERKRVEAPAVHASTVITIVKIVATVALIGGVLYLTRGNSSNLNLDLFPSGGSGSGSYSTADISAPLPRITLPVGDKRYEVLATRINMRTGVLEF